MSLDRSRIHGFCNSPAKVWKCPAGHMLQPCKAEPGACDGCRKFVCKGEAVLDCRTCNWYLCDECCPAEVNGDGASPIWDVLSFWIDTANQEVFEIATGIESLVSGMSGMSCTSVDRADLCSAEVVVDIETVPMMDDCEAETVCKSIAEAGEPLASKTPRACRLREEDSAILRRRAESECEAKAWNVEYGVREGMSGVSAAQGPVAKKQCPEDLMDFGEQDLLDLPAPAPIDAAARAGSEDPFDTFAAPPAVKPLLDQNKPALQVDIRPTFSAAPLGG
mmetsp:Transcript_77513/g.171671  ORF Transcript_77513/g.171671 Transcript_77513/m.171671 type:complete len:278 (-) Transcript_77513:24-857(-)